MDSYAHRIVCSSLILQANLRLIVRAGFATYVAGGENNYEHIHYGCNRVRRQEPQRVF